MEFSKILCYDYDPTATPEFAHLFNPTIISLRRMHRHATSFCLTTTDGAWRPWTRTTTCLISSMTYCHWTAVGHSVTKTPTKQRDGRSVGQCFFQHSCATPILTLIQSQIGAWFLHLIMAVLVYHALIWVVLDATWKNMARQTVSTWLTESMSRTRRSQSLQ